MDGGGVVGDEALEVVVDLEVIGHVAVLLPVCLIKLNRDSLKWVRVAVAGGLAKNRDASEPWVWGE